MLKVIIYWLNRLSIRFPPRWIWSSLSSFIILTNKNLETEDLCETDLTFNESPLFDCTQFFSSCQPICSRRGFSKSFLTLFDFAKQAYMYSNWTLKRGRQIRNICCILKCYLLSKTFGPKFYFQTDVFHDVYICVLSCHLQLYCSYIVPSLIIELSTYYQEY